MKKLILLLVTVLFFSCEKDDIFPRVENTTNGKKWTLQIGNSPIEVYGQLQDLGKEKKFGSVGIVHRKSFSKPAEIQNHLDYYDAITLQSKSGVINRAVIHMNQDKVISIENGGALLDPTSAWPIDIPDEIAIHINDPIDRMYEKLLAIYKISSYSEYEIVLSDKSLEKPFDPDMANYEEWAFNFSENLSINKVKRSFVRLFFNNKKLVKVRHEYDLNEVLN